MTVFRWGIWGISVFVTFCFVRSAFADNCAQILNSDLNGYESAFELTLPKVGKPPARLHGWTVVERDSSGFAVASQIRILVDNPGYNGQIAVIGPFNDWGKALRPGDWLQPDPRQNEIFTGVVASIRHGMPYRLLLNGKQVLDPSAPLFTTPEYLRRRTDLGNGSELNSIFWDPGDPRTYKSQTDFLDISDRPNLIDEVELYSLVAKYQYPGGSKGPLEVAGTYSFIKDSGVIKTLQDAGITAVEFLPFNQSVDGDAWSYRYQVFGNFAPDSRYGQPDEFKAMVDEFHRHGIAVIMDSVVSHFPFQANSGVRSLQSVGLDQWFKSDGRRLFAGPLSPWGTYRYDYSNPYVRRFLIDGITHMASEYKIDGVRLDNTDGIMSSAGGPQFLHEMVDAIRSVNPRALIIAEAFFAPNELLKRTDWGGYGFNTHNDSKNFDLLKDELAGPTEALSVSAIAQLLHNEFDWGEMPLLRYLTNHDEAANGRGGLTGAYPASLIGGDPYYAFSKVKAADGLNMVLGAYHVTMPQAQLMEQGSFYNNPAVDWSLTNGGYGKDLWDYFAALSRYMQWRKNYFNFASLTRDMENHVDDANKVISVRRRDPTTGKALYVLVNLGHRRLEQYRFGVGHSGNYRIAFDSQSHEFGGDDPLYNALKGGDIPTSANGEHGKPFSINVPVVEPYSLTIFEER